MQQVTITLNVPDHVSEMEIRELTRQCEMLASPDWIGIFWGTEDVKDVAPHLSDDQAQDVLHMVLRRHDATVGINWDVLETVADILYEAPEEEEIEE
jgi:hypothetical protein